MHCSSPALCCHPVATRSSSTSARLLGRSGKATTTATTTATRSPLPSGFDVVIQRQLLVHLSDGRGAVSWKPAGRRDLAAILRAVDCTPPCSSGAQHKHTGPCSQTSSLCQEPDCGGLLPAPQASCKRQQGIRLMDQGMGALKSVDFAYDCVDNQSLDTWSPSTEGYWALYTRA
ncbi:hypothetical protein VDGE_30399 [Verticillium dahliae]|uniref:Uncharacterized protein n=1 Tax=Verticillium dahliae TaxID=27337 RepID=A0A444RQB4_VERDA|nr:hypothetical protein VDGE_30399 [Verticillium dahliae]